VCFVRNSRTGLSTVPDGGNGGDGGDVIVRRSPLVYGIGHLEHYYETEDGHSGLSNGQRGKKGKPLEVCIPINASIKDCKFVSLETFILKGGRGLLGNKFSKHPNRGCSKSKGERGQLSIEMERFAHVVLIGPPNSGKSSLLNALCNTAHKVAPYPGSTERPNYGSMTADRLNEPMTLVEIPGLSDYSSVAPYTEAVCKSDTVLIVSSDTTFAEHEHCLQIVKLLGCRQRVIFVLSKCELGDFETMPSIPTLATSSHTMIGIAELKKALGQSSSLSSDVNCRGL
jgi:hypothetical protein